MWVGDPHNLSQMESKVYCKFQDQRFKLWYNRCVAVSCSVLQCVIVCCSVSQCVALCCSMLQCIEVCCSALQCVAVCCSVLQCVAVCCSVLILAFVWLCAEWWARHCKDITTSRGHFNKDKIAINEEETWIDQTWREWVGGNIEETLI